MCTLTLLPLQSSTGTRSLRLGFNRDESRQRPEGLPPRLVKAARNTCLMPVDPASGGTWIAASDAGFVMAVMNMNPSAFPPAGKVSRGAIITGLLGCENMAEAVSHALRLHAGDFAPFRLLLASLDGVHVIENTGTFIHTLLPANRALFFTSSGLGDDRATGPRRIAFDATIGADPSPATQDTFHRHRFADAPHLSVCMSRPDARTVSYTTILLASEGITMTYLSDSPDQPVTPITHTLPRRVSEALSSV